MWMGLVGTPSCSMAWACGLKTIAWSPWPLTQTVISKDCRTASSQNGRWLRKFANPVLVKEFECSHSHTGAGRISSKQSLTPHQFSLTMRRIYERLGRRSDSVIHFFQPLCTSGSGKFTAIARYVCERLCICWYWQPSWTWPLLRN